MLPVTYDNENRTDEHGGGGSGDRYYGDEKMHLQTNKEANKKKESEEGTRTTALLNESSLFCTIFLAKSGGEVFAIQFFFLFVYQLTNVLFEN